MKRIKDTKAHGAFLYIYVFHSKYLCCINLDLILTSVSHRYHKQTLRIYYTIVKLYKRNFIFETILSQETNQPV